MKFHLFSLLVIICLLLFSACSSTDSSGCELECKDLKSKKSDLVAKILAIDATDIAELITDSGCENTVFADEANPSGSYIPFASGNYPYTCPDEAAMDTLAQKVGDISVDRAVLEREVQVIQDQIDADCDCKGTPEEPGNLYLEKV